MRDTVNNFGWSYPPGCSGPPEDIDDAEWPDYDEDSLESEEPGDAE